MRNTLNKLVVFATTLMLITACVHGGNAAEKEMSEVSAALTKVSAAVHVTVRYETPVPPLADAALLDRATTYNTSLLDRFTAYALKARQVGKNSSVLVCKDDVALIEDAGCTGELDAPIWESQPDQPCDYVLDLATVCPAN